MAQQQLAGRVFLTLWHLTQTSSTSLQPSMQQGSQKRKAVVKSRQNPQAQATAPTFLRGMCDVLTPQIGHNVPSSSSLFMWMIVGP